MKRTSMVALLMMCPFLLAFSWNPLASKGTLQGQLFIVTRGGDNVRLGSVRVQAFSKETIDKAIRANASGIGDEFSKYVDRYTRAEAELNKPGVGQPSSNREVAELRNRLNSSLSNIRSNAYESAKRNLESWNMLQYLLPRLSGNISEAITDADGRFTMQVPKKDLIVLVAEASRELLNSKEKYYWMLPVSLGGNDSKSIVVSSGNMAKSFSSLWMESKNISGEKISIPVQGNAFELSTALVFQEQ